MKNKLLVGFGILVILALAVGSFLLDRRGREMERRYVATKAAEDSLRTRFDAAISSIAEIQDSLSAILPTESNVLEVSRDVERSGALTATRKSEVLRTISGLNESIQRSKDMIRRLEQNLKDRDVRIAALERIVDNLKRSVAEREQMIAALTQRVESLKVEVASLQTDVQAGKQQIREQEQVIEAKRREISTVYYIVAPKKKLKELGIVQESGGVIGIGKSARLSGQFPQQFFAQVDTDKRAAISVPGKQPVVLSGQHAGSYQIVPLGEERSELRITNPEEFRKVRYLVIQVK